MLKRLKLKFMVIASVMLVLIGFSSFDKAKGQEVCPGVPFDIGWVQLGVVPDQTFTPDFTAGLLGTIESLGAGAANIGGLDWLYNEDSFLNTTEVGGQLISWWSQKGGRNTYLQVTNTDFFSGTALHIQILGEDCVEIKDFCDALTHNDTHIYNLGDLVRNTGVPVAGAGVLDDNEGIIVVTPVDVCPDPGTAIAFNSLQGNMRMIDSSNVVDYGTNVYTRFATGDTPGGNTCKFGATSCTDDADCPPDACVSGTNGAGVCSKKPDCTCTKNSDCSSAQTFGCGEPGGGGICLGGGGGDVCLSDGLSCNNDADCTGVNECIIGGGGGVFNTVLPSQLTQNFAITPLAAAAASDLVLISFSDDYGPPYSAVGGLVSYSPGVFDDAENFESCTNFKACFVRLGIDDALPISEDFAPPTPTPSPTPTAGPPTATPTPTATATAVPAGGGGGCSLVGSTVQLGTAMANILIPLVPAFAIGYRVLRRRGRKEGK
ncbi:MAG TPA: hypothetical protein VFF49_00435 [Thermodesulfobacteriota bacterium]|nr:hypothetical protein [Thermodesulfobacteriota bacterium]